MHGGLGIQLAWDPLTSILNIPLDACVSNGKKG